MKKTKILSAVLTVVMLLSLLPVNVFAAKRNDSVVSGSLVLSESHMGKRVTGAIPQGLPEIKNAAATYKFYDNLTDFQKRIYNEFLATEGVLGQNISLLCSESELGGLDLEVISTNIYYALASFFEDNPEYYWLLYAPLQFEIKEQGSDYILELKLDYESIPYSNEAELRSEYNRTLQAVEDFSVSGSTRYEKVKSINDGLCELATYADLTGEVSEKVFYPSSCLLYPYETVCDGYSKAFKLICDRENIPCIIVCGYGYVYNMSGELEPGGHAWNYVQMEDGKWYAVDVTWNDSAYDSGAHDLAYDYFLKGRNSIDSSGDRFAVTHDPVGDRFVVPDEFGRENLICMSYPELSESEYDPNTIVDPIPDNPGTDVVADVNGDGKLSVVDAKWILQSLAGLRNLNSAQDSAADVNGDGKLSVVDAKWILQALAGLRVLGEEESHVIKNYPEFPALDLGAYFDVPYIDKVYDYGPEYGDIGNLPPADAPLVEVEYIYRQSDIESVGFVDDYSNLLRNSGFVYLGTTALVGWSYYSEFYSNNSVGVSIKYYDNGNLGVRLYKSNYIYQYSDYDLPDFGEIFDVQYWHLRSYSDGSATYDYELSQAKEADPNNEYFNILKENGFALVDQSYFENCGEYYTEWVFENSKTGVRLTVQTDDTYYTIMFGLIANLDRNDW